MTCDFVFRTCTLLQLFYGVLETFLCELFCYVRTGFSFVGSYVSTIIYPKCLCSMWLCEESDSALQEGRMYLRLENVYIDRLIFLCRWEKSELLL